MRNPELSVCSGPYKFIEQEIERLVLYYLYYFSVFIKIYQRTLSYHGPKHPCPEALLPGLSLRYQMFV